MLTLTNRIDMRPGAVPLVIHLGQYDSDFSLVFELYSSAGNFTVESGTTAMIRGTKTDGHAYDADATIDVSAKTVTVAGSEQMTAAKGRNVYELVLKKGTKVLSTANFILNVERAAMDADTIASESVLKELNAIIDSAATSTQAAADAASAADRAEDAADSVSSASTQIATNTADIADLKADLRQEQTAYIECESGTYKDADGAVKLSLNTRIRNVRPVCVKGYDAIVIPDGYEAWIFRLDTNGTYISAVGSWKSGKVLFSNILTDATRYINFGIRNKATPNSNISSEIGTVENGLILISTTATIKEDIGQWYFEQHWSSARYPYIQLDSAPTKVYYKVIKPLDVTGVDVYASNDGFTTQTKIYSTTETEFTAELNTQGYSALKFINILPASQTNITLGAIIHGFDDHSISQAVLDQKSDIEEINDILSKDPVNVYSYGALGMGLNYTNEIATAISACPENGVVYFPAGVYVVNDMALKSNMTIIGEGKATIIKLADNQPEGSNCCTINDVHDVTVRNISFDGNRLNEHAAGNAHDYGFNGVHIRNAYNVIIDTVYSYNNGYHGCIITNSHDVTIRNGEFHDNGYRPIHGHSTVEGVTVEGNICFNNGLGFDEGSGTVPAGFDGVFFFDDVHDLLIANNYIYDVNTQAGIQLGGNVLGTGDVSDGIVVCGNIIKTKGSAVGIHILGRGIRDVNLVSNRIENCDTGIYFYDTSATADDANRDIVVSSNTIRNTADIGIRFLNLYSNVTITGNTIVDGATTGVNLVGQHDILIQSNVIEDYKNGIVAGASQNVNIANNIIRAVKSESPMTASVLAFDTSSKVYVLYNFCSHRIRNDSSDGITLP